MYSLFFKYNEAQYFFLLKYPLKKFVLKKNTRGINARVFAFPVDGKIPIFCRLPYAAVLLST